MPNPQFTKPWHGVPRDAIHWNPAIVDEACIGCDDRDALLRAAAHALEERFKIRHVTLQLESAGCPSDGHC